MSLNDPQWGKRGGGGQRRPAGSRRDLAQRQPPPQRPARTHAAAATPTTAAAGRAAALPVGGAGVARAAGRRRVARERLLHRRRGPPRRGHALRQVHGDDAARPALAPAVPGRGGRASSISRRCKTIEVGYRNTPRNKVEREAVMLTDDENIIDIQFAVQYNLKSAEDYVFNNRRPDQIVSFVAETAIREVVGKSKMDFALYEGREQIAKQTEHLMQQMLDRYAHGRVHPEGHAAERAAARQGAGGVRRRGQGRPGPRAAEERRPGVRERSRAARARHGVATARRSERLQQPKSCRSAEGDASRFRSILVEYQKAPSVTRDRLYLDMMQSVLGNRRQGRRRPEGRQRKPALPAARQADAAGRVAAPSADARRPRAAARRPSRRCRSSRRAAATRCARARRCATATPEQTIMKLTMPLLALVVALSCSSLSQALYTVDQTQVRDQVPARRDHRDASERRPVLQGAAGAERPLLRAPQPDARQPGAGPHHDVGEEAAARSTSSCCGGSPTSRSTTVAVQGDEEAARRRLSQTVRSEPRRGVQQARR